MNTCVVIPTYNEKENIAPLLDRILEVPVPGLSVLFVDDSSPDDTAEEIKNAMSHSPSVHLLTRAEKLGVGSAYIEGFKWALENLSADVLVEMDSDLQHPPEKIPELLSALAGGADVAVASRKVEGGTTEGWSRWRRLVSWTANLLTRVVLGLNVVDSTSGFRALNARAARVLIEADHVSKNYFFQVESLYALKKTGMRMVEVPFTFKTRKAGRSKLNLGEILGFFFGVWRLRLSGS